MANANKILNLAILCIFGVLGCTGTNPNSQNLSKNSEIFKNEHSNKSLILSINGNLDKCERELKAKFDFDTIYKMPNLNLLVASFKTPQNDENLAKIMQNFSKFKCVARVSLDYISQPYTQKEAK